MMTVSISVNGSVVYSRTVRRLQDVLDSNNKRCYALDDGTRIWHNPNEGIVKLAINSLKEIEDVAKQNWELP